MSPDYRLALRASGPGRRAKPLAPKRRSGSQGARSPALADPASLRRGARRPDQQDGRGTVVRLVGWGGMAAALRARRRSRFPRVSAG